MKILLVSDNFRIAQFLQKGFEFEHLFTCLENFNYLLQQDIDYELYFFKYKAVIIYTQNLSILKKFILKVQSIDKKPLTIILNDRYVPDVDILAQEFPSILSFTKPFHFRSLASEIKFQIFKLSENNEQCILTVRDIKINLETREVFYKDKAIFLRNKEFALLQFFILNRGKLLSRVTILENVWDLNANLLTNTVDVHISRLRKIFTTTQNEPPYIKTVSCLGYIFMENI